MDEFDGIVRVWQLGYKEVDSAFAGLADHNVWQRPAANLVSIGELAGHIAHVEAMMIMGPGPNFEVDVGVLPLQSWLLRNEFIYPPKSLETELDVSLFPIGTAEVLGELRRIHSECLDAAKVRSLGLNESVPGWPEDHLWGPFLTYAAFHVGYHAGQMYTARHLLGEVPPDN